MRKHTPGPWKLEPYDSCLAGEDFQWGGIWAGPVMLDGINYGQPPHTPIKPETLERMEADARLIAAAPDLLEALQEATSALEWRWERVANRAAPVHETAIQEAYNQARAAIAKATGEKS